MNRNHRTLQPPVILQYGIQFYNRHVEKFVLETVVCIEAQVKYTRCATMVEGIFVRVVEGIFVRVVEGIFVSRDRTLLFSRETLRFFFLAA